TARASTRSFATNCSTVRSSTASPRPRSSSRHGGATTTPSDHTHRSDINRRRQRPSPGLQSQPDRFRQQRKQWPKSPSCIKTESGPPHRGRPILWPIFVIPIVLGIVREYRRLQQFTLACTLTLVVTTIVSIPVPAFGTYYEYGLSPDPSIFKAGAFLVSLHDVPLLRDGTLRTLDIGHLAGIITFPSFHAAAAI